MVSSAYVHHHITPLQIDKLNDFSKCLRAMMANTKVGQPPSYKLAQFLLSYRCTPHSTTGGPPS